MNLTPLQNLLPAFQEFFSTDKNQKEYEKWLLEQKIKKSKPTE